MKSSNLITFPLLFIIKLTIACLFSRSGKAFTSVCFPDILAQDQGGRNESQRP
jgi:hypothetical protein